MTVKATTKVGAGGPFDSKQRNLMVFVVVLCLSSMHAISDTNADTYVVGGTVYSITAPPEQTTIVIRDGVITQVDPTASPGPDDEIIDATGLIVTPGLIDFSTSLGLVEISQIWDTRDGDAGGDPIRAGFQVVDGLNPQSTLVPVTRLGGVTSVVSHPTGGLISGQSAFWDLAGERISDMLVLSPVTMDFLGGFRAARWAGGSRAAAMLRYRELVDDISSYLEAPEDYERGDMRDLSLSRVDIEALIPVISGELPVFFQVQRQSDILAVLRLAEEVGFDVIIGGGAESWAVAEELAAQEVPVVINPLYNAPYNFDELGSREDAAAILDDAGVPVIIATGDAHNVRNLRQLAGNAVRDGMDYDSALEAITLRPAQAAGLDDLYGSIDVGKVANLVLWSGDPLEIATRVRGVIIHGEQVPPTSRQTELFERYSD